MHSQIILYLIRGILQSFLESKKKGVPLKIFQHCLPDQSEKLRLYYEKAQIDFETFNSIDNLEELFPKINEGILNLKSWLKNEFLC